MLNRIRRALGQRVSALPAGLLARIGIAPNHLTVLGLLLAFGVAWVLSAGHFLLGGLLVLFSGAFDLLDGALARSTGRSTSFGAFLDSTFDRFSEGALFLGLLAYYADAGAFQEVLLIGAAIVGSLTTSYVRARAECLSLKCEVGFFTRPERVIVLAIGLIANQMLIALWVIAVLSNVVSWQRVLYVWQQSRSTQSRSGLNVETRKHT